MPTQQRTRGIAATVAGRQKLQETKAAGQEDGTRLTFEGIADRISQNSQASVDPRTVRRFFNGEGIDRDYVLAICTALGLEVTEIVDPNEWHPAKSLQTTQSVATLATLTTRQPRVDKWQGRQTEINELQRALGNDNIHLIGITAAGGYGKSALAVKLTEQLTLDWRVFWISFTQAYGFAQFGRWLLEELGLGKEYDEKQPDEVLIQLMVNGLIEKPCLLVLDNFETVLTTDGKSVYSQFLNKWLHEGINSKLLLTSREKPSFNTDLLPYFHWLALQGLAEANAMRLVTVDYGLTGTEAELASFVNKMGRHPLLMRLVCRWMVDQFGAGVTVMAADQLGLDIFTVEGYHRDVETSVGEVVAASLGRLSPRLGMLLKRLSVLRIAFDLPLARGLVAEVTREELRHLARLSLLQESPPEWENGKLIKPEQFQFLPLIQMFVQQQADSDVLRSAHRAGLDYFLAHFPSPPWESLADLTAYEEAFYHAVELGQYEQAYEILTEERGGDGKNKSVDDFLNFQGFNRQRAEMYESLISVWPLEQQQRSVFGKTLNNLGNCYYWLGDYKKAINYHQQSLETDQKSGNQSGIADSLNNLGNCYYSLGDYKKAINYHQQSLEIRRSSSNQSGIANSFNNLGLCYFELGDYKKAINYHQQSLEIKRLSSNQSGIANSFNNLGLCYYSLGDYKKAITYYQQSLKLQKASGNQSGIALSLANLGNCYQSLGDYEKAITYQQQSLELQQASGNQSGIALSLANLGNCYQSLGDYEKAITYQQQALEIDQSTGDQSGIAISLQNIGEILIKLEKYTEAETKIQNSLVISQAMKYKLSVAHSFKALAEIAHQTNQPQLALSHCQAALTLSQELGIPLVKDCEELLAKIQENLGDNG